MRSVFRHWFISLLTTAIGFPTFVNAQNSVVGDGFGGRLWYKPSNYGTGAYSGFTVCGTDSQLYAWGDNMWGALGDGTSLNSALPVKSAGMTKVKFVSCGYMGAAIKSDNSAWTWGTPLVDYYRIRKYNLTPIKVMDSAIHCDAGQNNVGFIKSDGTVWHYGFDKFGQFGTGTLDWVGGPLKFSQMKNMNNATRIAVSDVATAVLTKTGDVYMCGHNTYGSLGMNNIKYNETLPVKNPYLKNIVDIKACNMAFCALDKNGFVYTWGHKAYGRIGMGDTSNGGQQVPIMNTVLKNIVAISACNDGWHFMALDSAKNCYTWGWNLRGSCATTMHYSTLYPQLVATDVVDIIAGESYSMIVKTDGSLWVAGSGGNTSIWLNVADSIRNYFTKIDPTHPSIGLCPAKINRYTTSVTHHGVCEGAKFTFKGNSTLSGAQYHFVFNNTRYNGDSCNITLNNPGNYAISFVAESPSNFYKDSIVHLFTVSPKPKTRILTNDSLQCINGNQFVYSFTSPNVPFSDYQWVLYNETRKNMPSCTKQYPATGNYRVKLIALTDSGCSDSFSSISIVVPRPKANFDYNINYLTGKTTLDIFNKSNQKNVNAYFDLGQYGTSRKDTSFSAASFDNFVVKLRVTDSNGCWDTLSKALYFKKTGSTRYYIPTAFTPGGKDALNNIFGPVFYGETSRLDFKIYNRWGAKLYETRESQPGWDGLYMNKPCPEGMYVYMLKFVDARGNLVTDNGTFMLLRH